MDENKDNQHDSLQKGNEYLVKINELIVDVQERINIAFQKGQETKLKGYKDNLLKTKEKFENIHEERNEANITNNVFQYKKDLQKQCSQFFEKQMEVSKMYEKLKSSISSMNASERQLKLQIQYLKKQRRKTEMRGQKLKLQLKEFEDKYNKVDRQPLGDTKNTYTIEKVQVKKDKEKIMKNTGNFLFETGQRLRNRIQCTKQYMQSLLFVETPLQVNFSAYPLEDFRTDKQKLKLIEEIFSKKQVKKQIHSLLFD